MKTRQMMLLAGAIVVSVPFDGLSYEVCHTNGYTFSYVVSNGKATYTGDAKNSSYEGDLVIPAVINGIRVESLGSDAFNMIKGLKNVIIEPGIKEIGHACFYADGTGPTSVTIPSTVTRILGSYTFRAVPRLYWTVSGADLEISSGAFCIFRSGEIRVTALAGVPKNMPKVGLTGYLEVNPTFRCRMEHQGEWLKYYGNDVSRLNSLINDESTDSVEIISSSIRENDPTIMDVVYKVKSSRPSVKVRVLAFEDGERSFSKVVRPTEFVEGTDASVGDKVVPNVEHRISWRVAADWKTKLAKVKFEVLVREGELLPLETMTIPASDQYGKMKVTWNAIWDTQAFDALLWLYADKDNGLSLTNGQLKNGATLLADGTSMSAVNAMSYIYSKMGYSMLTSAPLTYANQETRLGLNPSGARQYGYKIVE